MTKLLDRGGPYYINKENKIVKTGTSTVFIFTSVWEYLSLARQLLRGKSNAIVIF